MKESEQRCTSELSSERLCNVHNTGVQGGSNTWGAYITKCDTGVQQETMSRERKKPAEEEEYNEKRADTPWGKEGRRRSTYRYIGYCTGYTSFSEER